MAVSEKNTKKEIMDELKRIQAELNEERKKGMATHSNILPWRVPRTEEPDGPHSLGSQTVRHN